MTIQEQLEMFPVWFWLLLLAILTLLVMCVVVMMAKYIQDEQDRRKVIRMNPCQCGECDNCNPGKEVEAC